MSPDRKVPERVGGFLAFAKFFLGMFTRNLPAKTASIVLAVLIWFVVRQDILQTWEGIAEVQIIGIQENDLILLGERPKPVKLKVEGPVKLISEIGKAGKASIRLQVRKEDLPGDKRRTLLYSIASGNISHSYGPDLRLLSMEPDQIELTVAVRLTRTLEVQEPPITGLPQEWEKVSIQLLQRRATITGPRESVEKLEETGIPTAPVDVGTTLSEWEDDEASFTVTLELAKPVVDEGIGLVRGERLSAELLSRKTRVPRAVKLWFRCMTDQQKWPVVIVPDVVNTVERDEQGKFWITLDLLGTKSDLDAVEALAKEGKAWAFVDAMDLDYYREKRDTKSIQIEPVRLELPTGLSGRVTFTQPEVWVKVVKEE